MTCCRPLSVAFRCLQPAVHCLVLTGLLLITHHALFIAVVAQSATATLSGTVVDQNGAVVPGATVRLINAATGLQRQTTTNDAGSFTAPLLPPSTYTVRVELVGFAPAEVKNVVLNVGDQRALQIQLKVGPISGETINVSAEANTIREDASVATVVDRQFVENLPLNGRSFQSLITLTPGVLTTVSSSSEQGQFSVNGQRANANYFMIDGVSANFGAPPPAPNPLPGQSTAGAVPATAVTGGTNNLVSVDALQEFRIQTSSYAPEFGRQPGGQVSIVTRSGTNKFSGTVFEYFRNDALDANDWFANRNGLRKPPLRQSDFGGVLGGPIWKNKTFFFFSYEGLRLRLPQAATFRVPTLSLRQSVPPAVQTLLNAHPKPNGRDLGSGLAEFNASYADPSRLNATSIRVDHTLSQRLTLFGRYDYSPSQSVQRSISQLTRTELNTQTLTIGSTWSVTPTISNDLRANWSKARTTSRAKLDDIGGAVPLTDVVFPPFAAAANSVFSFVIPNGPSLSFGFGRTSIQRQINVVDNFSVVASVHQLKFGIDYRYLAPRDDPAQYNLVYFFSTIANMQASLASASTTAGERLTLGFTNFSAYAQDSWKVTPRLVLTYGLRWEVNTPPGGKNGKDLLTLNGFADPAQMTFAPAGTPLWPTTYNNFAPRVGVAYQLSQRAGREVVVRAGFGVFYDLGMGTLARGVSLPPFTRFRALTTTYPADPALIPIPAFTLTGPFSQALFFDRRIKLPYTLQWNVALEKSLGAHQTVTASYVAAAGRRLLRQENIFNPNPTFALLQLTKNAAISDYHSLQLQYQRRLSGGLQALASYTWSHSLDTASADSAALTPAARIDPRQDRGPSDFDVRHNFAATVTYDIHKPKVGVLAGAVLGNWSLDTIVRARSATPVNVVVSRNIGFGNYAFRPDLVTGVPLYLDDPTVPGDRRINNTVAATNPRQVGPFFVPVENRQGNLGRNALRGYPATQFDFALRRQFTLTERVNLQFRAELFNAFNHPNFGVPSAFLGSVTSTGQFFSSGSSFGQSFSMLGRVLGGLNPLYQIGGSRSIQFALKLGF